jgi:hypothetical protein
MARTSGPESTVEACFQLLVYLHERQDAAATLVYVRAVLLMIECEGKAIPVNRFCNLFRSIEGGRRPRFTHFRVIGVGVNVDGGIDHWGVTVFFDQPESPQPPKENFSDEVVDVLGVQNINKSLRNCWELFQPNTELGILADLSQLHLQSRAFE